MRWQSFQLVQHVFGELHSTQALNFRGTKFRWMTVLASVMHLNPFCSSCCPLPCARSPCLDENKVKGSWLMTRNMETAVSSKKEIHPLRKAPPSLHPVLTTLIWWIYGCPQWPSHLNIDWAGHVPHPGLSGHTASLLLSPCFLNCSSSLGNLSLPLLVSLSVVAQLWFPCKTYLARTIIAGLALL